ncbi:MAG: hypothetical protein KF893_17375 [Caldilineaceae bacterium]|nr:hypothetical protein [Caldilineaceae bacterium]
MAVAPSQPETLYTFVDHPFGVRLFRSQDRALSWTQVVTVSNALSPTLIQALLVDPGNEQMLYLTNNSGTFRSTDGGLNWTGILTTGVYIATPAPSLVYVLGQVDEGDSNCYAPWLFARSEDAGNTSQYTDLSCLEMVGPLAVAADDPQIIYVSVGRSDVTLLMSKDGGLTWTGNRTLPPSVQKVAVDPTDPDHLLAATYGGVEQSYDGGQSWRNISMFPLRHFLEPIEVLFARDGTAYIVASRFGFNPQFDDWIPVLYRSDDSGKTWWLATEPLPDPWTRLVVAPDDASLLYAWTPRKGILRSVSGGATWQEQNNGIHSPVAIADIKTVDNGVIYVAASRFDLTRNGLFRSGDGGLSWTTVLTDVFVEQVVVDPQERIGLAIGRGKLHGGSATAGEMQWRTDLLWTEPNHMLVNAIDLSHTDPALPLIAGQERPSEYERRGIIRRWRPSSGGGDMGGWETLPITGTVNVTAVLVDPQLPTRLYASAVLVGGAWPLLISEDGGATWRQVARNQEAAPNRIERFYAAEGRLFALGFYFEDLMVSDDHGESWQILSRYAQDGWMSAIWDLVVSEDGQILVAADQGVYRWHPFLAQWESLGLPIGSVSALAIVQQGEEQILYASNSQGLWKRTLPSPPSTNHWLPLIER